VDEPKLGTDTAEVYERQKMINVTLAAETPRDAYELAREKYGDDFIFLYNRLMIVSSLSVYRFLKDFDYYCDYKNHIKQDEKKVSFTKKVRKEDYFTII